MKLAAIVAKTWFSASFQKIVSRKSGPAPETKIAFFGFLYTQKQKKTQGADRNPAQPRPETPSLWDGHRKNNSFPSTMSFFLHSLWKTARPSPKQAHTAVFQPKTIIVSSFASKSRQQAQNKPQKKKRFPFLRVDNAYGIRTRRHTLPSIFQKLMQ